MVHALYEDALGDYRNARALSRAADIAYLSESEARKQFHEQLGLNAKLISVDNTQAYVATNDDHVVVAFRGTEAPTSIEGLKDWLLTDAVNLLMVPEGRLGTDLAAAGVGARFHQGFVDAIAEIWDPVYGVVERELANEDRPLWITGHSLGGALAVLAAWLFHRKMISVHQVYTYGGPMVGNADAAKAINREFKGKIFRFVNVPDPVPRLPMMSLIANQYCHCDKEMSVSAGDDQAPLKLVEQSDGQSDEGGLDSSVIDELWNSIASRVAAHGMASYLKLVDAFTA